MTTKKTAVGIAAATLTAALLLTSCASGSSPQASNGSSSTPQKGGTVHVLQASDFSYLDPARGWDGGVNAFYRLLYRGLTAQAPGDAKDPNAIVPDLATSMGKPSADGLTWTYTLKDDIFFDTGAPITAQDMKFGIERAWDPQIGIGSPYLKNVIAAPANYHGPYKSGELSTITTPDKKTIVFHLKAPYPEFDNVVAQANAVPFPVGTGGGDEFLKKVIASGPYTLDSYTPGSTIKLKRNKYWKPASDDIRKAYPNAWQFDEGIDSSTIDERMIAGQGTDVNAIAPMISGSTLPRIQTPQLKARSVDAPAFCTTYMSMNMTKKPFENVKVRQAVEYALDRTSVQNASGGTQLADVATTIIPPAVNGHTDFDLYPSKDDAGDVSKAKQLLSEAGYPNGVTFTLDTRNQALTQAQSEAIQESLAKAGITVKLNVIDTSIFYETIATPAKQHEAAITGWCPDWASSASTFIPPLFDGKFIAPKGNQNLAQLNDPTINKQIAKVGAMTDIKAANTQWGELDKQIMAIAPIAPLVFQKGIFLPGANIAGYYPSTNMTDLTIVGLKDPAKG